MEEDDISTTFKSNASRIKRDFRDVEWKISILAHPKNLNNVKAYYVIR